MTETIIREPEPHDGEHLAALLSSDNGLRRDLEIATDDQPTGADVLSHLRDWCRQHRATTFAIVAGATAIGTISLSHRSADGRTARIGYWIGTRYRRQGHCTRAFAAVLRQVAAEGITTVSCTVAADNLWSRQIWERHGAVGTTLAPDRIRYELTLAMNQNTEAASILLELHDHQMC